MTTISVPGRITAIEVSEDDAPFSYAEYAGGVSGSPTAIEPTGNRVSVYKLSSPTISDGAGGFVVAGMFQLSGDFVIGDTVVLAGVGTVLGIVSGGAGPGTRWLKIASGTGLDWVAG